MNGRGTARQDADFALPELSGIVIPDVTSFTNRSQKYAEKLGDVAVPGSGVLVTGARCDPKGRVVNSASMTLIDHGDGSGDYDDAYQSAQNNGTGAGVYDDAYDLDLSRRRAQTVADALARRGVHATLVVTGFGENQPIAANELHGKDNPGGRQPNRRVEIIIPNG